MPTINCITYLCGCRVEINLEDDAYLNRGQDVQFVPAYARIRT